MGIVPRQSTRVGIKKITMFWNDGFLISNNAKVTDEMLHKSKLNAKNLHSVESWSQNR